MVSAFVKFWKRRMVYNFSLSASGWKGNYCIRSIADLDTGYGPCNLCGSYWWPSFYRPWRSCGKIVFSRGRLFTGRAPLRPMWTCSNLFTWEQPLGPASPPKLSKLANLGSQPLLTCSNLFSWGSSPSLLEFVQLGKQMVGLQLKGLLVMNYVYRR